MLPTVNVSLPDAMKVWVERQAATGGFNNASDYVRDLIRRDQERASKIYAMQRLVDEALAGGINTQSMAQILTAARREATNDQDSG